MAGWHHWLNGHVSLSELRELVMDREAWRAVIHGVVKSQTRLSDCTEQFPWWSDGKASSRNMGDPGFDPWVGQIPLRRKCQPTPVFLPGKSHGQRSLVGYSRATSFSFTFTFIECRYLLKKMDKCHGLLYFYLEPM